MKINIQEVRWGVDWINPAQDGNRWQALVKDVINFRFPYITSNFLQIHSSSLGRFHRVTHLNTKTPRFGSRLCFRLQARSI